MKIVLHHPTGNANVRVVAVSLMKAGLLLEFHTTIASFPGSLLDSLGSLAPFSEIHRRRLDPMLKPYTRTRPWLEAGRQIASRIGLSNIIRHETGYFSIDAVYHDLDRQVGLRLKNAPQNSVDAVYAYEDGALCSFGEAKKRNMPCFYDLPIGYWRTARQLLSKEQERWPEWASTLTGFQDSEKKMSRKDEELRLADRIFVASSFTANTLKDFPGLLSPIEVIPYGFPSVEGKREYATMGKGKVLKLLFVGSLSQRKGIAYLFAAVEALKPYVSLTIVGHKASNDCPALDAALAKHKWIPSLPHHDVLKLMREHDVLMFPSLFEGFGLVITEAMSQGTPVITTDRTAGPDLIHHGENGWLVEAGDVQGLQQCIEAVLQKPEQIAKAGQAAMETGRLRPWEVYGRELSAAIMRHKTTLL